MLEHLAMHKTLRTTTIVALLAYSSCSTYTPYSDLLGYGYTDTQLSEDTFEINLVGDTSDTRTSAKRYATYRAAHLAFQRGYPYFEILDSSVVMREHITENPGTTEIVEKEEERKRKKDKKEKERTTTITTTPSSVTVKYKPDVTLRVRFLRKANQNSLSTESVMQQARAEGIKF
jgi:hypothetical protein